MTYQDSVQAITGRPTLGAYVAPSAVTKMFAMNPAADGAYNPNIDMAVIQRYRDEQPRQDWVYAHEMGHRLDMRNIDPAVRQAFDSARAVNPPAGGYASVGRDEHFAEAFAQAITTLRDMSSGVKDPYEAQAVLSSADRNVPGSVAIMRKLMNKPIYTNHPMQDYIGMMQLPYGRLTGEPLHVVSR